MPPRKRKAPAVASASTPATPQGGAASGRRRSQRLGSSGKKSRYFAEEEDEESGREVDANFEPEDGDKPPAKRARKAGATAARKASGRKRAAKVEDSDDDDGDAYEEKEEEEDDDDDDEQQNGGDDDDDDDESEIEQRPKGRQRQLQRQTKKVAARKPKAQPRGRGKKEESDDNKVEDEDENDNDGDDDDDDGSPLVTFTPHKQLRDTGGVDYEDDRLHANTMLFLADLKANNKRSWLKANDAEYRRSLHDWTTYVESLTAKITSADATIPEELPAKDLIFRIYRDVRFSRDPTPYKAHYSAAWSRTGKKGPYACYYVHCEPGGGCLVGGGLWRPPAEQVQRLRASIDERPGRWRRVLARDAVFRRTFLGGVDGEEKALRAFVEANREGALKTRPKGFAAEHRDIELLKLRSFTVGTKIPDALLTRADGQRRVAEIIAAMVPFVTHLNRIVMPDPNDSDSDSDSESEPEDDDGGGGEDEGEEEDEEESE